MVLVVDDESLVLGLLVRVLREAGYDTLQAASAEEAIRVVKSFDGRIDVLLTDLKLPGASGQELAAALLRVRPDVRVIYMSGYCDRAASGVDALECAAEFVAKPFSRAALLSAIVSALPEKSWPSWNMTQAMGA